MDILDLDRRPEEFFDCAWAYILTNGPGVCVIVIDTEEYLPCFKSEEDVQHAVAAWNEEEMYEMRSMTIEQVYECSYAMNVPIAFLNSKKQWELLPVPTPVV